MPSLREFAASMSRTPPPARDTPPPAREQKVQVAAPKSPAERAREYRAQNREKISKRRIELDHAGRDRRRRHGLLIDKWVTETAAEQGGQCYLCGEPLGRPVIDHDHMCCPELSSCAACRRGLACDRCNRLIGQVGDDPTLLRRIADALEERLGPTRARIAAKPPQLALDGEL